MWLKAETGPNLTDEETGAQSGCGEDQGHKKNYTRYS